MSKEFFEPKTERFNEKNKECVINKLVEFREPINILKEIKEEYQLGELTFTENKKIRLDEVDLKVINDKLDNFIKKIEGIKPEMFGRDSHFSHIIGQLNAEMAYVIRLKKHLEKEAFEKAVNCCLLANQVFESLEEYIDLCLKLKHQEFLFAELFSDDGYWGKKTILLDKKKIEQMNAHEFIIASRDELEEKFENK